MDLFLLRRLEPFHANTSKRLVKCLRIYLRDSGLLHHLLGLGTMEKLLGYSRMRASWEGFVIEYIIASIPEGTRTSFFRSAAGAEIDLILELPGHRKPWAVEIKWGKAPKLERGFHHAREDVAPERCFVVSGAEEPFSLGNGIEAIGFPQFLLLLKNG